MTATNILLAAMSFSDVAALTRTDAAYGGYVSATGVVAQVVGWRETSGVFADVADPNGRGIYFTGETQRTPTASIENTDEFNLGDVIEVKGVATAHSQRGTPSYVVVAVQEMVTGAAPHHDGNPFAIVFYDKAQCVATGVSFTRVVRLLFQSLEFLQFCCLPD